MTIYTATALHNRNRRLDRKLASAELVLQAMRSGVALHLQFTRSGPVWTLTTGQQVNDTVAKLVTTSASVVSVDTALFQGCLGQSWRWWSNEEEPAA
jgi:hypothetical protein